MIPPIATRLCTILALALTACVPSLPAPAGAPRGASTSDQAAIVQAAEALFAAMASRDTAALRAMFVPDARIVAVRVAPGSQPVVRSSAVSDFVASVGRSPDLLRERMWDPRVEVDGDFASLWAPYEFHLGDRFSHCGTDAFHLVRAEGRWRFASLTYTVQPDSCPTPPTSR